MYNKPGIRIYGHAACAVININNTKKDITKITEGGIKMGTMEKDLQNISAAAADEIGNIRNSKELEALRIKYLGKKGELTAILKGMGALSNEERPKIGKTANEVREKIENSLKNKLKEISKSELEENLKNDRIDVTMPGKGIKSGSLHPLTAVLNELYDIFTGMGFKIADGPEIEYDYYVFEALNIPKDHPARDTQDTFYIDDKVVLRTQTSSVQIRTMEKQKPPIRIISPGRVYRSDAVDATHSPVFHQVEGLVVDKGITMAHLKGTLETFLKKLYGKETKLRFRPHHFPFTEPSAEVDVSCFVCGGKGCGVCKGEGFIEILGCGMVHPKVLRTCGIDPEVYSGFAFGVGLERIVMGKFDIDDLRLFYENDLRFLKQF
jgi:phenylalanyl-tRNA synthetase alpha chain